MRIAMAVRIPSLKLVRNEADTAKPWTKSWPHDAKNKTKYPLIWNKHKILFQEEKIKFSDQIAKTRSR